MAQGRYTIDILDRALDVLESFFQSAGDWQSLGEISQRTGLTKSRAFRILSTLKVRGYIEQHPQTSRYRLGLRLYELGELVHSRMELWQVAEPILAALAKECGDTVHLIIRDGPDAVCVGKWYGDQVLQVADPVWRRSPLYAGASPKLLFAFLPEEEREALLQRMELKKLAPNTITDRDQLRARLAQIREQGYGTAEQDLDEGVCAVSGPIRNASGQVIAAVSITCPCSRFYPRREALLRMVLRATEEISRQLGYGRAGGK
ncbi:MAG: IclR family transcriptional regulator [Chloroflexia bacterium]